MVNPDPKHTDSRNNTAESTGVVARLRLWLIWSIQYWRELLNFRFDKYMIVQVLPGVYGLLLAGIALSLIFFTVVAFRANLWYGLYFLVIVMPLGFLVAASVLRGVLELYLVVFRISEKVDELVGIRDTVDRFSSIGQTVDQMVAVTRKIPFWAAISSSGRTRDPSRSGDRASNRPDRNTDKDDGQK